MDCYEHFDFDIQHLRAGHLIFSPVTESWSEATKSLWDSLILLKELHLAIKNYSENIHDGQSIETAEVLLNALDSYAEMKSVMQVYANEFCFRYKGYSLN